MQTDAELVKAVLDGDRNMYEVLVNRYEKTVRTISLRILHDFHLASDVSQDAFVNAFENLARLRRPDAFGPWLMKITHRCAIKVARKRPRNPLPETETSIAVVKPGVGLDEDEERLLAAVVRLPKAEKQVIILRYFGQNSVKDVAEMVGKSIGTVTKQLSRAHKRLRKILLETEVKL